MRVSEYTHGAVSRLMTVLLVVGATFCLASCDPVPQTSQGEPLVALLVAEGGAGLDAGTIRGAGLGAGPKTGEVVL